MNERTATIRRRVSRAKRTKARLTVNADHPRLLVNRSNHQIYAQIIDPAGQILASADSLKLKGAPMEVAGQVGELIAKQATEKKISAVTFDRKHYRYHGRVKALAEGARKGGLKF